MLKATSISFFLEPKTGPKMPNRILYPINQAQGLEDIQHMTYICIQLFFTPISYVLKYSAWWEWKLLLPATSTPPPSHLASVDLVYFTLPRPVSELATVLNIIVGWQIGHYVTISPWEWIYSYLMSTLP